MVRGTADPFFPMKWAHWLRDAIPGATGVVEIPDGKLFFPDERAEEFAAAILPHWRAHPTKAPAVSAVSAAAEAR